jgi:uncharacterized protein
MEWRHSVLIDLSYFLTALALVMVIEGILPFLSPGKWRDMIITLSSKSERTIRIFGFASMMVGALLMALVHSGILD